MYGVCKVERGGTLWHGFQIALGGEHHDFGRIQVELDVVEQVECVGLRVVEYFFNRVKPLVELILIVGRIFVLILPMCSKAHFGNVVHAVGAYLHFNPFALF